jgi:dipeptidyl aminopeptidase/acylaminoacyl peptidase
MPYVDTSRAVAAGFSYGGYMMNYIAGQPLGKKFQTLISQSGIFSLVSLAATDSPGNNIALGPAPWNMSPSSSSPRTPELNHWDKFDPARYTHNWTQPMLFIHGEKDFVVPVSQALAAYNVCQLKGIKSRLLTFPDEAHSINGKENSYHWFKTILGWANKYAGIQGGVQLEDCVGARGVNKRRAL